MQAVGAAFGDDVHYRTRVATIFGLEVRDHSHLGYSVNRKDGRWRAEHASLVDGGVIPVAIIHVCSIEEVVVRTPSCAVHRELAIGAWRIGNLVRRTRDAGIQIDQFGIVASVHGQILYSLTS